MKRFWTMCAVMAMYLLAGVGFVGAAEQNVTFPQGWLIQGTTSPFFAAIEKGFFKKHNLNVKIVRGFGSSDTIKKVAAGAAEYGIADAGALVVARSRGAMVKVLALEAAQSQYSWFTMKGSGIRKPKDLEGRVTGGPQGDLHKTLFPAFAKVNGIDMNKVTWNTMPPNAMIGSLLSGKIEFVPFLSIVGPVIQMLAKKSGREAVRILWANWGVDIYSLGVIAHDDRISQNRKQVAGFVDGAVRGMAWAIEHPGEAIEILKKHNPSTNAGIARKNWEINIDSMLTKEAAKIGVARISEKKMRHTRDLITKYSNLKVKVPVKDLYSNDFSPVLFPKRGK